MATAGTGDVLAGVIAALLGQGLSPFDAARLGAWVHGRAGDAAAADLGEVSMTARDLLDRLHVGFQACSGGL
jgi:NAD(P)H-hydrate epimerase